MPLDMTELLWSFKQLPKEYLVVDCETTGLFDEQGAPGCVSVGICLVSSGEIVDGEEFLVKPHRELTSEAASVNGFTPSEIMQHPEFSDQWGAMIDWLDGYLVVCHNALFDWGVITDCVKRYNLEPPCIEGVFCSLKSAAPWAMMIDSACSAHGPSVRLLTEILSVENLRAMNQDKHSALIDAKQTALIVEKLRTISSSTEMFNSIRNTNYLADAV